MYHRVADPRSVPPMHRMLCVSPTRFAEQLDVLSSTYRLCPLPQWPRVTTFGRRCVAVTFDDGYADNTLVARPLLEQYQVPATIFVSTAYTGQKAFWWDDLLARLERRAGSIGAGTAESGIDQQVYHQYHQRLATCDPADRQSILDEIGGVPPGGDGRPVSLEELTACSQSEMIQLQAHTRSHPCLAKLTPQQQLAELKGSKEDLEQWLGHRVRGCAYPFGGRSDYSAVTVAAARECGFDFACTTVTGCVDWLNKPYELPRFMVLDWDGDEFAKKLRAWFSGRRE